MKHTFEVHGVQLNFGLRTILSDVYVRCDTGMVTGLLGRNGAGKSCFMQVAFGTLNAYSKSVRCDSKHIVKAHAVKGLINYLPQFYFVPGTMRVRDALHYYGLHEDDMLKSFPEYGKEMKKQMNELSGGQRRMIEIYMTLKAATMFTILDEPFSHIMPLHVDMLKQMIDEEKKRKGIIVTDHLYRHILDVSDRLYLLQDGKTHFIKNEQQLVQYGYLSHWAE